MIEISLALLVTGVVILIIICSDIRRNLRQDLNWLKHNYWLVNREKLFEQETKDRALGIESDTESNEKK